VEPHADLNSKPSGSRLCRCVENVTSINVPESEAGLDVKMRAVASANALVRERLMPELTVAWSDGAWVRTAPSLRRLLSR